MGIGVFLVRWVRFYRNLSKLISASHAVLDLTILQAVERTRQLLFLDAPIQVRTANSQMAPFVMGFRKPVLFLPSESIKTWNPRDIQAVIGHELAHLRRYDLWVHAMMQALRALLWFWPPVWWMQRELHRTQDAACDECAIVVLGSGIAYGESLTLLAEQCLIPDSAFPALGLLHSQHALLKRMENIMNQPMISLTRISLHFKLLFIFTAMLFFSLCGIVSQGVASQTLDLKFLANYPDYKADAVLYSDPYTTVMYREQGKRFAAFYLYQDGEWIEQQTIRQESSVEDETVVFRLANERFTVLITRTSSGEYKGWILNHRDLNLAMQTSMTFQEISGIYQARLEKEDLYVLIEHPTEKRNEDGSLAYPQGRMLYRYSILPDTMQIQSTPFFIPEPIYMVDFDLLGDRILFIDKGDALDLPENWERKGVALGEFGSDSTIQAKPERWYFETIAYGRKEPLHVKVNGSTVYVSFFADAPNPQALEILIADWSIPDNPQIVQRITNPRGNETLNSFDIAADGFILGIHITKPDENQLTPSLAFYQRVGNEYQFASEISGLTEQYDFGDSGIIAMDSQSQMKIYDLSDPTLPLEVTSPSVHSISIQSMAVAYQHVYYLKKKEGTQILAGLDTAVPSDIRSTDEIELPFSGLVTLSAHDSLLTLYSPTEAKILCYSYDETGKLVEEIPAPSFPESLHISRLSYVEWNSNLFVAVCVANNLETHQANKTFALVYERNSGGFSDSLSITRLPNNAVRGIALSQDTLVALIESNRKIEQTTNSMTVNTMNSYSLRNPERPELLSEYDLFASQSPYFILDYAMNDDYWIYSLQSMSADSLEKHGGIVDIRNPQSPYELAVDVPQFSYVQWYQNVAVLDTQEGLAFYRIANETELQKMGILQTQGSFPSLAFSENRLFLPRMSSGLDIYQIRVDEDEPSSAYGWEAY